MKRIDTATKATDLFGAGKHGFKDGDLALGIYPTDLDAEWFNQLQEEVANVIEAAGLTLNGAVLTQLLQAIPLVASVPAPVEHKFPASGTYTKSAGMKRARVRGVAGGASGGGGGGANTSCGGGGGGGGFEKWIDAADLGATEAVTIGLGGAISGAGAGTAGGTTSFGAHCQATGGAGGDASSATAGASNGGAGGVGTGGDINFTGSPGQNNVNSVCGGAGGSSVFGGGARAVSNGGNGVSATGLGGGGAGGGSNSTPNLSGAGADGYCIVEEFF